MRTLENAAAQIAGYGVKLIFVAQTLAQLKDVYKDNWETLIANAGVKMFFCNDDHFTREYVSKLGAQQKGRVLAGRTALVTVEAPRAGTLVGRKVTPSRRPAEPAIRAPLERQPRSTNASL